MQHAKTKISKRKKQIKSTKISTITQTPQNIFKIHPKTKKLLKSCQT